MDATNTAAPGTLASASAPAPAPAAAAVAVAVAAAVDMEEDADMTESDSAGSPCDPKQPAATAEYTREHPEFEEVRAVYMSKFRHQIHSYYKLHDADKVKERVRPRIQAVRVKSMKSGKKLYQARVDDAYMSYSDVYRLFADRAAAGDAGAGAGESGVRRGAPAAGRHVVLSEAAVTQRVHTFVKAQTDVPESAKWTVAQDLIATKLLVPGAELAWIKGMREFGITGEMARDVHALARDANKAVNARAFSLERCGALPALGDVAAAVAVAAASADPATQWVLALGTEGRPDALETAVALMAASAAADGGAGGGPDVGSPALDAHKAAALARVVCGAEAARASVCADPAAFLRAWGLASSAPVAAQ